MELFGIEGYIESCYNLGTITENYTGAGGTVGIGGILGFNYKGNIENCYNIGEINTNRNMFVENIVGNCSNGSIVNCYYLENSMFQGLGEAVSSKEMKKNDFVSKINGESGNSYIYDNNNINNGYPILYWQKDNAEIKEELTAIVSYDPTSSTIGKVTATIKTNKKVKKVDDWTLSNDGKTLTKTYSTNTTETVHLVDLDGMTKDVKVKITNIIKNNTEIKEELTATVSYNPTSSTIGKVTATIKINKKVNKVDGWTLSDDGKKLTKTYETNATEIVHLVDLDGMTKDVEIKINNITSAISKQDNEKDTTTVKGILPQTGVNMTISIVCFIAIILVIVILYKKYNSYKDIK